MPLELDQEVCTLCRTPRDEKEIEAGRALVQEEELRRERRPRRIAVAAAAVALLATAWLLRGLVVGPLLVAWSDFRMEVEKTRQPSHWVKGKPVLPPAAAPSPAAAPPAEVVISSFVYLNPGAPASQPADAPVPEFASAPAPPKPPPVFNTVTPPAAAASLDDTPPQPGELHVKGRVYDLKTLKPLKHVTVRFFHAQTGARWEALTNEDGRYKMVFFGGERFGLTATIEAPGYRKGLLEDSDPPYHERSAQSRADFMSEVSDSDLEPVPLRHRASEQIVQFDLVVVPKAKD